MLSEENARFLLGQLETASRGEALRPEILGQIRAALRELLVERRVDFREYLKQLEVSGLESRPWSIDDEPPFPLDDITREGLGILTPEELLALAGDKHCLDVLRDLVLDDPFTDAVHEEWQDTLVASVERCAEARRAGNPKSSQPLGAIPGRTSKVPTEPTSRDVSSPPTTSRPSRRKWTRAAVGAVLAATLLVAGVLFDRLWFQGGGDANAVVLHDARASVAWVPMRGSNEEAKLKITSPIAGFAVAVCLANDRPPLVVPALGQSDIPVSEEEGSEAFSVPGDTTSVVFVVTETPAGEPVRREFDGRQAKEYTLEETVKVRTNLLEFLQQKGYRRIAVGSITEVPTNAD